MDFIFDRDKLKELNETITLFKKFDKYKHAYTREELYYYLLPSFKLVQYKIIKDKDNKVIGFANWALMNKEAEKQYCTTTELEPWFWNSGLKVWLIDIICVKDTKKLMSWIINYFKKFLLVGERINWIRINESGKIYRRSFKEKRSYHK